eukprot:10833693-Alexandrium_andersonii.AAC.1
MFSIERGPTEALESGVGCQASGVGRPPQGGRGSAGVGNGTLRAALPLRMGPLDERKIAPGASP